jgi:RNA polymerase sigma factor (TIGR02999 family)
MDKLAHPVDAGVLSVNALLERWAEGDSDALKAIVPALYGEIHAIAVRQLRHERHLTLQPTALVHEVYLRLSGLSRMKLQDRALIDEARRRRASKRGDPVTLSDTQLGEVNQSYDAIDIDDLLNELERYDALAAEVVALRVFGGLSIEEVAEATTASVATVNRRWAAGKVWLTRELARQ